MIYYILLFLTLANAQMCRYQRIVTPTPKPIPSHQRICNVCEMKKLQKLKFDVVNSGEWINKNQIVHPSDLFLKQHLPMLYKKVPTPTYKPSHCRTKTSFDACMLHVDCAWCKISLMEEGCYSEEMTSLLPTHERCIEGGDPIPIKDVPYALCGDWSFDDCELLPTIDIYCGL